MPGSRRLAGMVCLALAALVCIVFARTFHYGFVNYDDGYYVYENPAVLNGLSWHGILWAFTHTHGTNWHPLTTLSHMLDCQLFPKAPGRYHMENVLLHATAAVLLFLVLRETTGAFWPCAFAAAVFAIHPLRVESVAWISERKDVLGGVFFMLTIWAYLHYTRKPDSWRRHTCVSVIYALGLMAKPMLVTLPFVLLLLDYWPLKRFAARGMAALVIEKIPLALLSAACCIATLAAQRNAIGLAETAPFSGRVANAFVSCAAYIGQMFYPVKLAVLYPFPPGGVQFLPALFSILLVAAVTALAFAWRHKRPYLLAGWLWYLGMLVPVIGIVQVGAQAHADRYTYLPQIGLCIALAWSAKDLCAAWRIPPAVTAGAGCLAIVALAAISIRQTAYWRNSETLWLRALACTKDNSIAHLNYGHYLFLKGRNDEAIAQYQAALRIQPDDATTRTDYGIVLNEKGETGEALQQYEMALVLQPDFPEVHNNIANLLYGGGDYDGALEHCEAALELRPGYADAHCMIAMVLEKMGRTRDALSHYARALELQPDSPETRGMYDRLLRKQRAGQ